MSSLDRFFGWSVRLALAVLILAQVGCGKGDEPTPNGQNPNPTKPAVSQGQLRMTLEVWCDEPIVLSFWGCSFWGVLSHEGKTYGSDKTTSLMKDLGKRESSGKYYKTEFETTDPNFLFVNCWISLPKSASPHLFYVTVKSRTYLNGRLEEKYNVDEKNFRVGLLGQNFQLGKSLEIKS